LPITTRSSAITSISWSRWEDNSTGAAAVGVVAQQATHPADAGRVKAVGRLVQDQDLRLTDQRGRDAQPLAHAEGVVADPPGRLLRRQADQLQHLLDASVREPHEPLGDGQDLSAGAPGVLRGRIQTYADLESGVG